MKSTGVIIARFQTPFLHDGHGQLINHVRERHNKVVIVLGISQIKGSIRNPFDFHTRERMVKKEFPDVVVLPLADQKCDGVWSSNLDTLLSITFPNEKFILYGSRDSFIPYYSGKYLVSEMANSTDFTGSDLREQMSDKVMDSRDFRCGIIYANYNLYPKIYPTVDIALFRDHNSRILLGYRQSEQKWRLPGGFADPSDENFEASAIRELVEECGNIECADLRYERSFKIDDWRYHRERDKIITLLYSCTYIYGELKCNDDLDKVQWFNLECLGDMIANDEIVDEHRPMVDFLKNKYVNSTTLNQN